MLRFCLIWPDLTRLINNNVGITNYYCHSVYFNNKYYYYYQHNFTILFVIYTRCNYYQTF